jgi:hypothetical protein
MILRMNYSEDPHDKRRAQARILEAKSRDTLKTAENQLKQALVNRHVEIPDTKHQILSIAAELLQ